MVSGGIQGVGHGGDRGPQVPADMQGAQPDADLPEELRPFTIGPVSSDPPPSSFSRAPTAPMPNEELVRLARTPPAASTRISFAEGGRMEIWGEVRSASSGNPTLEDARAKLIEILDDVIHKFVYKHGATHMSYLRMLRLRELLGKEAAVDNFSTFINVKEVGVRHDTKGAFESFIMRFVRPVERTPVLIVGTPGEDLSVLSWFLYDSEPFSESETSKRTLGVLSTVVDEMFQGFTNRRFFNGIMMRSSGRGTSSAPGRRRCRTGRGHPAQRPGRSFTRIAASLYARARTAVRRGR